MIHHPRPSTTPLPEAPLAEAAAQNLLVRCHVHCNWSPDESRRQSRAQHGLFGRKLHEHLVLNCNDTTGTWYVVSIPKCPKHVSQIPWSTIIIYDPLGFGMHHSGNDYDLLDSTPTLEESWLASVAEMISKLLHTLREGERHNKHNAFTLYILFLEIPFEQNVDYPQKCVQAPPHPHVPLNLKSLKPSTSPHFGTVVDTVIHYSQLE